MSLNDHLGRIIAARRREILLKLLLRDAKAELAKSESGEQGAGSREQNPNGTPKAYALAHPYPNGRWS